MKKLGYQVFGYNTPDEVFEHFEKVSDGAYPDLLIVDLILGDGLNGLEVLTKVREYNPAQKTLVISGHSDMKHDPALREARVDGFIDKPFTIKKLADSVRSVLNEALAVATELAAPTGSAAAPPLELSSAAAVEVEPPVERRILIVDDEETIRQLFQVILQSELSDVKIDLACNGAEAVEACEQIDYDVLIMDLHMPVMDGKAAFLRIQDMNEAKGYGPSVVFCTGFAPPDSIKTIISKNSDHGLLRKPITGAVLVAAVKDRLAG